MPDVSLASFQNHEFIIGAAVAVILVSALVVSSLFRNVALAFAAGTIVLLYLQGGVKTLIATSTTLENEIRAIPEFSNGLLVGLAVTAGLALLFGLRHRST